MAKRKFWEDLNDKEDFFVQMPYTVLDSTLSNEAKVLFMHLWKDAFTNNKKHEGKHYSDMTQVEMAKKLGYKATGFGIREARRSIKELNQCAVVLTKKQYKKNTHFYHYFLAKHRWQI
ncbi:hypothetical protein LCGC14_0883440 [marine sediment metagenome]|uniref:Uncharacterized protein n=1 Tax=marine sediment metagenome TaxID=412755 RepID=A0A0F9P166_9ZZZZ